MRIFRCGNRWSRRARGKKLQPPRCRLARRGAKPKPIPPGARTHLVEPGETLASIAAKYYKNRGRWKEIQDANNSALGGSANIKPGQRLVNPVERKIRNPKLEIRNKFEFLKRRKRKEKGNHGRAN